MIISASSSCGLTKPPGKELPCVKCMYVMCEYAWLRLTLLPSLPNRYPVGYDPANPTYYTNCANATAYCDCAYSWDRFDDNVASNPLVCPLEFFSDDTTSSSFSSVRPHVHQYTYICAFHKFYLFVNLHALLIQYLLPFYSIGQSHGAWILTTTLEVSTYTYLFLSNKPMHMCHMATFIAAVIIFPHIYLRTVHSP